MASKKVRPVRMPPREGPRGRGWGEYEPPISPALARKLIRPPVEGQRGAPGLTSSMTILSPAGKATIRPDEFVRREGAWTLEGRKRGR